MIAEINTCIVAGVSVFGFSLNFLALRMILRHTQPEIRSYKPIMLQTVIADLLTLSINVIVQPVFFSDNGWGTIWCYGPAQFLPNPWQNYVYRVQAFMARYTSTGICSLFIYRYFLLNRDWQLSSKAYAILIAVTASPTLILQVIAIFTNTPTAENEHLKNGAFIQMLGLDNATAQRYVVPLRSGTSGGTQPPFKDFMFKFVSSFAMAHTICSYAIIVLFGLAVKWHIYRHYRGPTMAAKRRLNRQISVVLFIQASLPLLTFIPQLFANAVLTFNISVGPLMTYLSFFANAITTFICVLNPIVTLLSVSCYRTVLFKWICGCCKSTTVNNNNRLLLKRIWSCKKENNLTMTIPSKNAHQRAVPTAAISISLPVQRNVVFPRK